MSPASFHFFGRPMKNRARDGSAKRPTDSAFPAAPISFCRYGCRRLPWVTLLFRGLDQLEPLTGTKTVYLVGMRNNVNQGGRPSGRAEIRNSRLACSGVSFADAVKPARRPALLRSRGKASRIKQAPRDNDPDHARPTTVRRIRSAMKFAWQLWNSRRHRTRTAGRELQRRGHEVRLAVPPNLVGLVESAGLGAVPYGRDQQEGFGPRIFSGEFWKIRDKINLWHEAQDLPCPDLVGDESQAPMSVADGTDLVFSGPGFPAIPPMSRSTTASRWRRCTTFDAAQRSTASGTCRRRWSAVGHEGAGLAAVAGDEEG